MKKDDTPEDEDPIAIHKKEDPSFTFWLRGKWVLKIEESGIKFNHEGFPDFEACDFVKIFIHILECNLNVKFTEKDLKPENQS